MSHFGDLEKALQKALEKALEDTAVIVEGKAKSEAPYDTGNLRDSIQAEKLADLEYQVTANTEYALAVHEGHQAGATYVPGRPYLTAPFAEEVVKIPQRIKENL